MGTRQSAIVTVLKSISDPRRASASSRFVDVLAA